MRRPARLRNGARSFAGRCRRARRLRWGGRARPGGSAAFACHGQYGIGAVVVQVVDVEAGGFADALPHAGGRCVGCAHQPDRIPRWLGPISGDLRLGGHDQLEGNAGGTIETCDPPRHLGVTWEYEGGISWVDVHLAESGDDTTLRLEHFAFTDDFADKWDEFGPGAVGIGWDLTLLGLAEHLATGADVNPDPTDAAGVEFMRLSSDGWCRASIAYGTPPRQAEQAAARRGRLVHRRLMHAFDVLGDPVRRASWSCSSTTS